MSTGINLGFATPLLVVDIDNEHWFADLFGVPDRPDATDKNKMGEARALVLAGIKAAIADGVVPTHLVALLPDSDRELVGAATALGVHASPAVMHASDGDMAALCDAAHSSGAKFVCVVTAIDANAISRLQASGVEPDAWFVRGAAAKELEAQARAGGRDNVAVVAHGDGALGEDGYGDALRAWASGETDAGAVADQIGAAITAAAGV